MSSEWVSKELEEVATEVTVGFVGSMASEYIAHGIPFLRSLNVEPFRINTKALKYISPKFHAKINKSSLQPGDVVIVRTGKPGASAVIPEWLKTANCSDLVIVRCGEYIRPHFLCYWINSVASHHILSHLVGAVQQHFNVGAAKKMQVLVPSLREQDQIITILGSIDDRITLLSETNATLEAIAQALFKSWFVDFDPVRAKAEGRQPEGIDVETAALFPDSFEESELGLVPKGWRIMYLGKITQLITKGTTPTTLKRSFVKSGINFVKVESLSIDGQFLPEKFAYIDEETHELLKRSQLQAGDVLITIAGTIGRVAIMTEDFLPANTNQAIAIIRPKSTQLPSGLLKRFLKTEGTQQSMKEKIVQAVQANLSLGSLSELKVIVPPCEITAELYEAGITSIDNCMKLNHQNIRTLTSMRDTLLPRLISGQLRLPEASTLMESTPK